MRRCLLLFGTESFVLLSKNIKIKIYRTMILSVVLYGYETWSFALRVEHRLKEFENGVLRKISGPKRIGVTGKGEDYGKRNSVIFNSQQILFGWSNQEGGGTCSTYRAEDRLVGMPDGKGPLGRPGRRWKDNIKRIFKKWDEEAWILLIWFNLGRSCRRL